MKSKLEKSLKEKAYKSVPDKWDELKKEISEAETKPENPVKHNQKINVKPYIAAAASIIVIIGCAVGIKTAKNHRIKIAPEGIQTDGSAVISFTDENGKIETTIAHKVKGESDLYVDDKGNKFYIDGNTTSIVSAESDNTKPKASDNTSKSTESATENLIVSTTAALEAGMEKDDSWSKWSLPSRFNVVNYNGKEYVYTGERYESRYNFRNPTVLKKNFTLKATDNLDKEFTQSVNIVSLQGFGTDFVIGVKFPLLDYPVAYMNVSYQPETLAGMMEDLDWDNTVTYERIHTLGERIDMPVSPKDVSAMLKSGKNAPNIQTEPGGRYLTITVDLNELNVVGKYFRIYESGYVTTNIIGYRYCFNIGTKAVADYLMKSYNMTFAELDKIDKASPAQPVTDSEGKTTVPREDTVTITTKGYFGSIPE